MPVNLRYFSALFDISLSSSLVLLSFRIALNIFILYLHWLPVKTFSITVISAKSLIFWNVLAMPVSAIWCGFRPVISSSLKSILPFVGG